MLNGVTTRAQRAELLQLLEFSSTVSRRPVGNRPAAKLLSVDEKLPHLNGDAREKLPERVRLVGDVVDSTVSDAIKFRENGPGRAIKPSLLVAPLGKAFKDKKEVPTTLDLADLQRRLSLSPDGCYVSKMLLGQNGADPKLMVETFNQLPPEQREAFADLVAAARDAELYVKNQPIPGEGMLAKFARFGRACKIPFVSTKA